MSVCLMILHGDDENDTVEVMAPDYDSEYLWLWYADTDSRDRIDLTRKQLVALKRLLNEILP